MKELFQQQAVSVFQVFGTIRETVTYISIGNLDDAPYNTTTGAVSTINDIKESVQAIPSQEKRNFDQNISVRTCIIQIPVLNLTLTPKEGDKVLRNNDFEEWQVVSVETDSANAIWKIGIVL